MAIARSSGRRTVREAVMDRLAQQCRRFPDLIIEPLDTSGLDDRDARLAHAIDQAAARRWLTLATVLQRALSRPWDELDPGVQAALLAGAAQLLLLERIPDHAAINEAVEWTKPPAAPPGASGLVNAVLRKVARWKGEMPPIPPALKGARFERNELPLGDGRVRVLEAAVFDEDEQERLAQQTSLPGGLIQRWRREFGEEEARRIAMHGLVVPPVIVTGVEREAAKPQAGLKPHEETGFFVFEGDHAALVEFLRAHPGARVQDPGSAAPVEATRGLNPTLIVDFCAGRGTKTRQLAGMHPGATIIATDIDHARRASLREAAGGVNRIRVVEPQQLRDFAGKADLLVLDVPCSNTGVLARRVEARYRVSEENLASLTALQRRIIAEALPLLSPGGRVLYATCSLETEENAAQVRWVAERHGLRIESSGLRLPRGHGGEEPATYSDGSHFALLRREVPGAIIPDLPAPPAC